MSKSRRAFAKKLRRSTSENKIIAVEWKHARNSKGNDWRNKLEAFDANGTSQGPVFSFRVEGPRGRRLSVSITPVDRCRGSIGRNFTRKVVEQCGNFRRNSSGQGHTAGDTHVVHTHTFFYELPHERRTHHSQDRLAFQSRTFRGGASVTLKPYPTRSVRVLTCCPP